MLQVLDLDDSALWSVVEIVHEIDLRDCMDLRTESSGGDAVLRGWQRLELSHSEIETGAIALFEGLNVALAGNSV